MYLTKKSLASKTCFLSTHESTASGLTAFGGIKSDILKLPYTNRPVLHSPRKSAYKKWGQLVYGPT